MMSMCRVFSCVVGRGCLLWPVRSLGKILLAFFLLHSVLQGQICLLLQVFLDFLPLHFNVSIKTVCNNLGHWVVADPPANLLLRVSLSYQPPPSFFFLILFLLYFTLQYCIGFATRWHESTMGVYELPMFIAALSISYSWNAKILEMQNKLVVVRD